MAKRQGDVLVDAQFPLPWNLREAKRTKVDSSVILARGEVTGHNHLLEAMPNSAIEVIGEAIRSQDESDILEMWFEVKGMGALLRHTGDNGGDHFTQFIAPGLQHYVRQTEENARPVYD